MSPLSLGDLVDLEARALEEQGEPEEVRRTRYRQLGRRLADPGPLPEDNASLLKALLRLDPRPDAPGKRFEGALALLHALVSLLGLLVGVSLSLSLLQPGGPHPVNVLTVLTALVGTQLLLLAILIIALLPRQEPRTTGPVLHLLRAGLRWILARAGVADRVQALADRLDAHRGLLRWILVRVAQIFGVSFNLAALAGCFYRIAVSDIAFGWSTTLPLDADAVRRLTAALAAPWSWFAPHGVPSAPLIRLTQYSHLEGRYLLHGADSRSLGPALVGGWWVYILYSLACYGLLPRLAALAVGGYRVRRILGGTPTSNEELARLCEWMRSPVLSTRPEGPDPAPMTSPAASGRPEPERPPAGSACELLDGAPPAAQQLLRDRFGWTLAPGPQNPLVAVVSAWEEPTKGQLRRFAALGDRLLIVALHDPSGTDDARRAKIRDRWKRELPKVAGRARVETL
ncbi:MAG TPA: DUF2868 domain-containing protein [Planctomycetota bacterium]|nr:DUF2868 domain-containing protein [Planctomycetota bacterium]